MTFNFSQFKCIPGSAVSPVISPVADKVVSPLATQPTYPSSFFDLPAGRDPVFPKEKFIVSTPSPTVTPEPIAQPREICLPSIMDPSNLPPEPEKKRSSCPTITAESISANYQMPTPMLSNRFTPFFPVKFTKVEKENETEPDDIPDGKCLKKGIILKKTKVKGWHKKQARVFPAYLEVAGRKGFDPTGELNFIFPFVECTLSTTKNNRDGNVIILEYRKKNEYFQGTSSNNHTSWLDLFTQQIAQCKENPDIASEYPKHEQIISNTPPAKRNTKHSKSRTKKKGPEELPEDFRKNFEPGKVFGRSLIELEDPQIDRENFIPRIIFEIVRFLDSHLEQEGLFRVSGSKAQTVALKEKYDDGQVDCLGDSEDPDVVAGLLKQFLRELKEPLLTFSMYHEWMKFKGLEEYEKLGHVRKLYHQLPPLNKNTVKYLLEFFTRIAQTPGNLMSAFAIAVCVSPNILWNENSSMEEKTAESQVLPELLAFLIDNNTKIVKN